MRVPSRIALKGWVARLPTARRSSSTSPGNGSSSHVDRAGGWHVGLDVGEGIDHDLPGGAVDGGVGGICSAGPTDRSGGGR